MLLTTSLLTLLGSAIAAPTTSDPGYNCQPGQKCWPSWQEWQQFNRTIDGHLYETVPLGAPCYVNSTFYDPNACRIVQSSYNDSIPRGDHYGQTYWPNWEACGTSGCTLLSENPEETLYPTCTLGRLATYYVDVRINSHVSAALKFAHAHNIRISIKNTGHDFFGRSVVPNSLAIWTHNLNSFNFYPNFTASNCPSANGHNIGEMGAGVIASDAYHFFGSLGMDVTGGYEGSVGIAGGFGQGGGVGDFTTLYGLMSDNAVEFEVVLASGEVRIINECNDPDLFWSMRGGGGGSYAVLTKYRVQVYPSLPIHTYNFVAEFTGSNATMQQALRTLVTAHATHQLDLSAALITGQGEYSPTGASFDYLLPYNDDGSKLREATSSFATLINNVTGVSVIQSNYTSYAAYVDYLSYSTADARATEPAGIFSVLSSRLIPRNVFTTPQTLEEMVNGVIYGIEKAGTFLPRTATQVVMETPLSNPDVNATAALPAWRDAIWHVINVGEWEERLSPDIEEAVTTGFLELVEPLKQLTPGGGSYVNEAHWGEEEWEETFFGAHYEKLLEIKQRYDPTHIFDCWKCVGWRGENDPFYGCYKKW